MRTLRAIGVLIKSIFTCVHLADKCTADEFVKKVADDGDTETWNCWCTCKCGETKLPKTKTYRKGYLDQLRSSGVM